MGITATLSEFVAAISLDRLPPEVTDRARFLLLDLVGNIVRARHDAESTESPSCAPPGRWASPAAIPACSAMRRATPRRGRRS